MLRDKNVMEPIYVNTKENLADLFTKILPKATFEYLRDQMMVKMITNYRAAYGLSDFDLKKEYN